MFPLSYSLASSMCWQGLYPHKKSIRFVCYCPHVKIMYMIYRLALHTIWHHEDGEVMFNCLHVRCARYLEGKSKLCRVCIRFLFANVFLTKCNLSSISIKVFVQSGSIMLVLVCWKLYIIAPISSEFPEAGNFSPSSTIQFGFEIRCWICFQHTGEMHSIPCCIN